jgi:hypothetical protein
MARHLRIKIEAYLVQHDQRSQVGRAVRIPAVSLAAAKSLPVGFAESYLQSFDREWVSPMNREIFEPESSFLPESRERPTARNRRSELPRRGVG